jgi:succinate dehydrogenase/fumarate reductase flavoprotein subunit
MMKEEIMEADVLCVGGGIAGLMAGIRAAELGAKVIIADKANTLRSGAGATGNDHFRCYIPEVHGTDVQPVIDEITHSQAGGSGARPVSFIRAWMEKSFDIVKLWHSWGIPMQYEGKWEFAGHGLPGKPLTAMKYAGQNQKPILTREALKKGARIVNRTMIFDLLTDARGAVTGAIGIDYI